MGYLIPVIIVVVGMAAEYLVEISAELSTDVLIDTEVGINAAGPQITAERIIDMRPEASIAPAPDAPVRFANGL